MQSRADLLEKAIEAHGGLALWQSAGEVRARVSGSGFGFSAKFPGFRPSRDVRYVGGACLYRSGPNYRRPLPGSWPTRAVRGRCRPHRVRRRSGFAPLA